MECALVLPGLICSLQSSKKSTPCLSAEMCEKCSLPYTLLLLNIPAFAPACAPTSLHHSLIYEKTLKIMARFRVILIFALCCFSLASHSSQCFCVVNTLIIVAPRALLLILHFIMDFFSLSPFHSQCSPAANNSSSNSDAWIFFLLTLTPLCAPCYAATTRPSIPQNIIFSPVLFSSGGRSSSHEMAHTYKQQHQRWGK